MKVPVRLSLLLLGGLLTCLLSSCHDDDDAPFPSIVSELVDCPTDSAGILSFIVLDNDTRLELVNPQEDLRPSVVYRALAGYAREDDGRVTLYTLQSAALLRDSTQVAVFDPTAVVSLWCSPRYLNLHLRPKTQGGKHDWGYATDSLTGNHAYLRLHHRQGDDPVAYSTDLYASLRLSAVEADTITLRIRTFDGMREWTITK